MQYTIEQAESAEELACYVNQKLAEGWEPLGALSVAVSRDGPYVITAYCQAMIKRENDD